MTFSSINKATYYSAAYESHSCPKSLLSLFLTKPHHQDVPWPSITPPNDKSSARVANINGLSRWSFDTTLVVQVVEPLKWTMAQNLFTLDQDQEFFVWIPEKTNRVSHSNLPLNPDFSTAVQWRPWVVFLGRECGRVAQRFKPLVACLAHTGGKSMDIQLNLMHMLICLANSSS